MKKISPLREQRGDFAKGILERREVEKRILIGAAHGFRAFHGDSIPPAFEQLITKLKTKNYFFVNKPCCGKWLFTAPIRKKSPAAWTAAGVGYYRSIVVLPGRISSQA